MEPEKSNPFRKFMLVPISGTWRFFRRYPVIPAIILLTLVLAAIFGPLVAPYERDIGVARNGRVPPFSHTTLTITENDETIDISLSGNLPPGVAFASEPSSSITIADDDANLITVFTSTKETPEGNDGETTLVTVTVAGIGLLEEVISFKMSIKGSALLNSDYQINGLDEFIPRGIPGLAESGSVILEPGNNPSKTVDFIVLGDDAGEPDETLTISLSGQLPEGFKFGAQSEITFTISDDDREQTAVGPSTGTSDLGGVTISVTPSEPSILEGATGDTSEASFIVSSTGTLDAPVELRVDIAGSAEQGKDYTISGLSESGGITLPAGALPSAVIMVTIIGDDDADLDFEALNPPTKSWWQPGYYLFGTDQNGRDIYTRLLHGAQISMQVVAIALISGMFIGTTLGIFAGYYGGVIDELITRFVDIWYALPFLLVALVVTLIFGRGIVVLMVVLALIAWAGFVRVIRAQVLIIKHLDYVNSARITGASDLRIMWKHILPGVLNTAVVVATLNVSGLILGESVLSFVGAGIQPPTPSWGVMTSEGRNFVILGSPHISLIPGGAIFLVVLAFNFMGDWLRDRLDPRLRQVD